MVFQISKIFGRVCLHVTKYFFLQQNINRSLVRQPQTENQVQLISSRTIQTHNQVHLILWGGGEEFMDKRPICVKAQESTKWWRHA